MLTQKNNQRNTYLEKKSQSKNKSKKAQIALEFVSLFIFALMLSIVIMVVLQKNLAEAQSEAKLATMDQLKNVIEAEIDMGLQSNPGYLRRFELPRTINGAEYGMRPYSGVSDRSSEISIQYKDQTYVYFFATPVRNFDILQPGYNTIEKVCPVASECYLRLI